MTQIPNYRSCPQPAPRRTFPTTLGNQIARHAGPLSMHLVRRNYPTGGHIIALRQAIVEFDDVQSREVALCIARMDPGHPDAIRLLVLLDAGLPEALN